MIFAGNAIKTAGVVGALNPQTLNTTSNPLCALLKTSGQVESTNQLGNSAQGFLSGNAASGLTSVISVKVQNAYLRGYNIFDKRQVN